MNGEKHTIPPVAEHAKLTSGDDSETLGDPAISI